MQHTAYRMWCAKPAAHPFCSEFPSTDPIHWSHIVDDSAHVNIDLISMFFDIFRLRSITQEITQLKTSSM